MRDNRAATQLMPVLARWYIKAGLVYFLLALSIGLWMALDPSRTGALRVTYVHLLTVGWITQLIVGVGYWMFPKYTKERPRGSEALGWASFVLLNAGLILRAIAEPRLTGAQPDLGWVVALSAVLQGVAAWLFVINTWPRIKGR